MSTGCCCHACRYPDGDPVTRANHADSHEHFAELEAQHYPARRFPPLEGDHETRLRAIARGMVLPVTVRRVSGVCHRLDCPHFVHPAHAA